MRLEGVLMDQQRESQGPSAKIATSTVQLMHQYTGRGPTKAKTTINENIVTVLLADTLTNGRAQPRRERPRRIGSSNSATTTSSSCVTTS